MHFWSEGLGDSELVMNLEHAKLERKDDVVLLTGIVDSPAPWEYEVKVEFDDWLTILRTATSKQACDFIAGHVGIRALAAMAWSTLRFVVLLAAYRFVRLIGWAPVVVAPVKPLERTKQS
jgi:hypothetical protein